MSNGSFRMSSIGTASLGDEVLFNKMILNLVISNLRICLSVIHRLKTIQYVFIRAG